MRAFLRRLWRRLRALLRRPARAAATPAPARDIEALALDFAKWEAEMHAYLTRSH